MIFRTVRIRLCPAIGPAVLPMALPIVQAITTQLAVGVQDSQPAVSGPVRVAAVADGVDLHLVLGLVDAVDDPVGPAPGRVEAVERLV